jgi:hypothetical protein
VVGEAARTETSVRHGAASARISLPLVESILPQELIQQVLTDCHAWERREKKLLFECFLSRKDLILLQAKLAERLVVGEDSVRFYPLCANCVSKVETVGGPWPTDDLLFVL